MQLIAFAFQTRRSRLQLQDVPQSASHPCRGAAPLVRAKGTARARRARLRGASCGRSAPERATGSAARLHQRQRGERAARVQGVRASHEEARPHEDARQTAFDAAAGGAQVSLQELQTPGVPNLRRHQAARHRAQGERALPVPLVPKRVHLHVWLGDPREATHPSEDVPVLRSGMHVPGKDFLRRAAARVDQAQTGGQHLSLLRQDFPEGARFQVPRAKTRDGGTWRHQMPVQEVQAEFWVSARTEAALGQAPGSAPLLLRSVLSRFQQQTGAGHSCAAPLPVQAL
jgi:hypothetical protein